MKNRYYASVCTGRLEIKASPLVRGPQSKEMVPPEVNDLFSGQPNIKTVAIEYQADNGKWSSVVYNRLGDEENEPVYSRTVTFSSTGNYGCGPEDEDDVYTVEEFLQLVKTGAFIDYDGYGNPVKDNMCDPSIDIRPSRVNEIPKDATHIVWYNR